MLRLTVRFLFGYALVALGLNTSWWLLVLIGMLPILSAMSTFIEGLTAAIQAVKEE